MSCTYRYEEFACDEALSPRRNRSTEELEEEVAQAAIELMRVRVPVARDLDLGGVRAEELHVRVRAFEQGRDEPPRLRPPLDVDELRLQGLLLRRCERRLGRIGLLDKLGEHAGWP
jgi:hypothetical protein